MAGDPDPELVEALAERADDPEIHTLSPEGARRMRAQRLVDPADADDVARVRDLGINGPGGDLPVRIYDPEGDGPHPVLVFFHGGGWVIGDLDTHDPLCRALCNAMDAVVVAVDYRLAPEHTFPAAAEDAYAATEWVADQADALSIDPDRLAVAGDSAGGNLVGAVTLMARDRDGPEIAYQFPIYPVTDHTLDYESYPENEPYGPTAEMMAWFWDAYMDHDVNAHNPYASPLRARSLADLPPATVVTCELDCLRDEGIAYAERLEAEGVDTTLRNYEGMTHGFMSILGDPDLSRARDAVADLAADVEDAFSA